MLLSTKVTIFAFAVVAVALVICVVAGNIAGSFISGLALGFLGMGLADKYDRRRG